MFYVLRTHGEVTNHWGITAIATYDTIEEAKAYCKDFYAITPTKDKLIIVKGKCFYAMESYPINNLTVWTSKERTL